MKCYPFYTVWYGHKHRKMPDHQHKVTFTANKQALQVGLNSPKERSAFFLIVYFTMLS
jgi:hypothetical protein